MKRSFLIATCWLAGMSLAYADAVYTWVDRDGVTHFSQTPPPQPGARSRVIELAPLPPPAAADNYYSIIRQAERMEKRRLENEKLEAQRRLAEAQARRARMEAEAAAQPPVIYQEEGTVYLPAYPYYPGYGEKPWRPGGRPGRPGHWPDEPGYRPGQPGRPQPGPGFRRTPPRIISAIPARR